MPDTALDKDVNYVLSFVQIEHLIKEIQGFDSNVFNIIEMFYEDVLLPVANQVDKNPDQNTVRMIIPRIATYIGETNGTEAPFEAAFCTENNNENVHDFEILGKTYKIQSNESFDYVIGNRLRTTIFNDLYSNVLHPQFLYFVIHFKDQETIEKVYKILGNGLYIVKYNDVDKTISIPCHNRIVFGAPGTGKSWKIKEESAIFEDNITRVTFHPEYSYYDFVGSYKPVMNGENIQYKFVAGPFARMLRLALDAQKNNTQDNFCLIVEEINRARVAAVFGDIFQLLDRNISGESEYEIMPSLELARYLQNNSKLEDSKIEPIRIPNNLYIWATMNSADQGVYPLDTAFKRRWSMEYIPYNPPEGKILTDDKWNQIREGINKLLLEKGHVNEDKLMGYYFLKEEERTGDKLKDALQNKVLMYLFDDAAKHCRNKIFKIEGKDVITFSELQDKMSAEMENGIVPESDLGVFVKSLHQPDAGQ